MFRALTCPSSGARDYACVIAACGVKCLGCWWSAVGSGAAGYASRMREIVQSHNFRHPGRIACCSTPNSRPPATKALHTICGNNTSIVSSSWWWAYECPKHVEQIIIAIKHSVASSWFSSLRLECYIFSFHSSLSSLSFSLLQVRGTVQKALLRHQRRHVSPAECCTCAVWQ
jgi:hypothetical protein